MRRRVWILVLAAPVIAAVALLVGGSGGFTASAGQAQASSAEVKIDNFSFGPAAVTVAVGTTMTWSKRDDIPRTRGSDGKGCTRKWLGTGGKVSCPFPKAGA